MLPHGRQPGGLFGFQGRVEAQRLIGLLAVGGEPVHPDDDPLTVVDFSRDPVGRVLDLGLLETLLDRCRRAAHVLDAVHQLSCG